MLQFLNNCNNNLQLHRPGILNIFNVILKDFYSIYFIKILLLRKEYNFIRDTFSRLIFKGQPFEILDGDNFQFNKQFVSNFVYNSLL